MFPRNGQIIDYLNFADITIRPLDISPVLVITTSCISRDFLFFAPPFKKDKTDFPIDLIFSYINITQYIIEQKIMFDFTNASKSLIQQKFKQIGSRIRSIILSRIGRKDHNQSLLEHNTSYRLSDETSVVFQDEKNLVVL